MRAMNAMMMPQVRRTMAVHSLTVAELVEVGFIVQNVEIFQSRGLPLRLTKRGDLKSPKRTA